MEYVGFFQTLIYRCRDSGSAIMLELYIILSIYSGYEQIFVRMKNRDNQDKKIRRKHRWRVLRACKLSLRRTAIFKKEYVNKMYQLMPEEKFDDIMKAFKEEYKKS